MANVNVAPNISNPTHHMSLNDGISEYGLKLENGWRSMVVRPGTPSTIHISGGSSRWGQWSPDLAEIGPDTFIGGRGSDSFYLDETRYYDANMTFTAVDGRAFPAPQWRFAEGIKAGDNFMPGAWKAGLGNDLDWLSLASNYYAQQFGASSSYSALNIQLWVRRIGNPANNLKVELRSDSSGDPGTVLKSATVAASSIDRLMSEFYNFAISSQSLTGGTTYWVVVYDDGGGTTTSHWEVGYTTSGANQAKVSSDSGSSWSNADDQIFFRVVEAETTRFYRLFEFRECLYGISRPVGSTASKLFINGDRGKATGGASTTITDTNKSWTADQWIGAWVRIIEGTGAGQSPREIIDSGTDSLTVSDWEVTPDNTSLYIIYATDTWTDISPGSGDQFDKPVTDVAVLDEIVYFARGNATDMIRMRWNDGGSPPAHEFADETGTNSEADVLYVFSDATNEAQIYVGNNSSKTVVRFGPEAWGTALGTAAAGTSIDIGDDSANIVSIADYNGDILVYKSDGIYQVSSDKALRLDTGIDHIRSSNTGEAVVNRNFYNYFSWGGFELNQMQKDSSRVDMVSLGPNRGVGLPAGRRGKVSKLGFHPAGLLVGIDAGADGTSSVLIRTDPTGYHEIMRAPLSGKSIREFYWQDCPGTFPRFWTVWGDELVYQEWPRNALNPLQDSGVVYQHETSITLADIDMGAPRLPKMFKQLSLISENLTTGIQVSAEYQVDDDIGGTTWTRMGDALRSPEAVLDVRRGNIRKIRIRLRLQTNDADVPPVIRAAIIDGFARTPLRRQWTMRVKTSDYQYIATTGAPDHSPPDLIDFLFDAAQSAKLLRMRSQISAWHDIDVVVEPATDYPSFREAIQKDEGHVLEFTVREL